MSTLPPNLVGPILQTPLAQRQISNLRDSDGVQRANAQRLQTASAAEKDSTIETADNDTQVHTDSEGQGSQGRAFSDSEPENPSPPPDEAAPEEGRTIDFKA